MNTIPGGKSSSPTQTSLPVIQMAKTAPLPFKTLGIGPAAAMG